MDICTKTDNPMNGKAPVIEFYRYVFMVVLLAFHGGTHFFQNGYFSCRVFLYSFRLFADGKLSEETQNSRSIYSG